jgi:hypothetical protein
MTELVNPRPTRPETNPAAPETRPRLSFTNPARTADVHQPLPQTTTPATHRTAHRLTGRPHRPHVLPILPRNRIRSRRTAESHNRDPTPTRLQLRTTTRQKHHRIPHNHLQNREIVVSEGTTLDPQSQAENMTKTLQQPQGVTKCVINERKGGDYRGG